MGKALKYRFGVALVITLMLAACSSQDALPSDAGRLTTPPGSSQPFDAIDFSSYDAVDASIWRYQTSCAAKRGFQITEQPKFDSGSALLQTAAKMGDATSEAARRNGLHNGPIAPADQPGRPKQTRQEAEALEECYSEASGKLGSGTQSVREAFTALVNDMSATFYTRFRPKLDRTFLEVNQCTVKKGWKPVDMSRLTDPAVPPAQLFGVRTATATTANGRDHYTPLPREIDLALAMAECRSEGGVPQRLVAEAIKLQQPIVDQYEQRIIEMNSQIRDLSKKATERLS